VTNKSVVNPTMSQRRNRTTRGANASTYVGRVSGLAVAMGVGVAVWTGIGCGTAAADTGAASDSGSSSSSDSSSGNSSTGSQSSSSGSSTSSNSSSSNPSSNAPSSSSNPSSSDSSSRDSTSSGKKTNGRKLSTNSDDDKDEQTAADNGEQRESASEADTPEVESSIPDHTEATTPTTSDETIVDEPEESTDSRSDSVAPTQYVPSVTTSSPIVSVNEKSTQEPADANVAIAEAASDVPTDVQSTIAWALTALSRRETSVTSNIAAAEQTTTSVVADTEAPTTIAALLSPAPPMTPAEYQAAFTGKPSMFNNMFVSLLTNMPSFIETMRDILDRFNERGKPPGYVTLGLQVTTSEFDGWQVVTLTPPNATGKRVVALHGGSYVLDANQYQWTTYANMARQTGATVVVPIFPLAPVGTAGTVVPQVADLISHQIDLYGAENVSVLGDSSGGQIALSAVQLMIAEGRTIPGHMVLISPRLDNTFSNPNIPMVHDPLVNVQGGHYTAALWAGGLSLTDPLVSPIYGSLDGLPPTLVYSAEYSLLSPDALYLQQLAQQQGAPITFVNARGQVEDWVIFAFLPDAQRELPGLHEGLGLIPSGLATAA